MQSELSNSFREKNLNLSKNKEKSHKIVKSDLTYNRIKEDINLKYKNDNKIVSKNPKKIKLRNRNINNNDNLYKSNTQSYRNNKKRINHSMIFIRSHSKNKSSSKNKKNYNININNKKDIQTEYFLYQKELKTLMDKEEKIKQLKNQLKQQDNNFSFNQNYLTERSNTNLRSKNKKNKYGLNASHSPDIYDNDKKVKKEKKIYSKLVKRNSNKKSKNNVTSNNDSYRHYLNNYSNDITNEHKEKYKNKDFIKNSNKKNNIKINLYPYYKNSMNTSTEINNDVINSYLNTYNYSFKKQKPKKNITNLNKNKNSNKDLYNIYKKNAAIISNKNVINNTKNKKNNNYSKINDSSIQNNSMNKNTKSKTNYDNFNKKYINKSQNKNESKNKKKITNNNINDIKIKTEEIKNEEKADNEMEVKERAIDKIGIITKAGEDSPGEEKINQDNYFDSDLSNGYKFIGVCDGHGDDGHKISEYLRNNLPDELNNELENLVSNENIRLSILEGILRKNRSESEEKEEKKIEKNMIETFENLEKMQELFKKVFVSTNLRLIEENYMYNLELSGSTCSSIFLQKNNIKKIYIANVGDSRTIIIREPGKNDNKEKWSCEQLSRDHKPNIEGEEERILKHGGEIQQIQNEKGEWEGPFRIFMKNEEGPGLAMSRSFGDVLGSMLGVICEPEVFEYILRKEDKAIIIASDGLWEYVENEEVTDIVKNLIDKNDADLIVNELYKFSYERWKSKDIGIDDITIICVLLK